MKKNVCIIFLHFLVFSICIGQNISKENDPVSHPNSINKKEIDKINNQIISFYLNNKSIDGNAKLFYKGKFAISDDDKTFAICDSITTNNALTRPFYLYVFCRILELSDGAVSEVIGGNCLDYMKKFPCEFMKNLDSKEYNIPQKTWFSFVAFELSCMDEYYKFEKRMNKKIKESCNLSNPSWQKVKEEIKSMLKE